MIKTASRISIDSAHNRVILQCQPLVDLAAVALVAEGKYALDL